jgi:uncharacterized membrane protein (UPF0127 family)
VQGVRNDDDGFRVASIAFAGTIRPSDRDSNAKKTITIIPQDASASPSTFRVVLVCDTAGLRAKGLQGFRRLEPDEAALFLFERAEPVSFWMGSVFFPIDIVFIGPDRIVNRVYPFCKPASLDHYPSIEPAKWVIETAAGSGIKAGDRVKLSAEFGMRSAE